MATTAHDRGIVTLHDLAKLKMPDGKITSLCEQLTLRTPFLQDVHWQEGNLTTGHRIGRRTALPSIGWRGINEGVAAGKSEEDTIDETCGMLQGRSEIDVQLLKLNGGNPFRLKKEMAFVPAFMNELETGFFYHSTKATPKKFMGLSPRLDSFTNVSHPSQVIQTNLITPSGNEQSSAWFVGWGPDKVYGIVPKDSHAGLDHQDLGDNHFAEDAAGNKYRVAVSEWTQHVGLCVEDARYVVRVPNLDSSAMVRTGSLLIQSLIEGYHQIEDHQQCRCVLYVNRFLFKMLHHQAIQGTFGGTLTMQTLADGRPLMTFLGCPIRMSGALLATEAVIS